MILKKGASGRRRLMDGVICQLRPNYEAALAEYGRLLDQKSALLRERYDNPSLLQVLPEYDLRMAQTARSSFRTAPAMSRRWRRRPRAITANFPATARRSS